MTRRLLVVAWLAGLVAACTPQGAAVPTPTRTPSASEAAGGHLRVAIGAMPRTLDPWQAVDPASRHLAAQVFDTLVAYEPGTLRVVPGLAEAWELATDQRTWTFTLRAGARFHDGAALDAGAVASHFERALRRGHPARGADAYESFAALWLGFDESSALARVEAKDARTVVFVTRMPFGPLLDALAHPSAGVVSPGTLRADPLGWMRPGAGGPAGTGPFVIASWEPDGVLLVRDTAHWRRDERGRALPYLDRLTLRAVADPAARVAALRSGAADVAVDLEPPGLQAVRADPNLQILPGPALGMVSLGVARSGAFADVGVRRAAAQAVSRAALAQAHYAGEARPASQLVAPGTLGYDDSVLEFARPDEAAAKRAVADATGGRGVDAELGYPAGASPLLPEPRRIAESIAADLARVGIRTSLRALDDVAMRREAAAGRLALWLDAHQPETADPAATLEPLLAGPAGRDPLAPPALAAALLAVARAETQPSARSELYKQVSKIAREDVLRIPLVHVPTFDAATRKVQGRAPGLHGLEPLGRCWLAR